MWILTTLVFLVLSLALPMLGINWGMLLSIGLIGPFLGAHPGILAFVQLLLLPLAYALVYVLVWLAGDLVDWMGNGEGSEGRGAFSQLVATLEQPWEPCIIPMLVLAAVPVSYIIRWRFYGMDPIAMFIALAITFSAAQAIRPFGIRRHLLPAIMMLPGRYWRDNLDPTSRLPQERRGLEPPGTDPDVLGQGGLDGAGGHDTEEPDAKLGLSE